MPQNIPAHAIAGVATSVAAFVGTAARGPFRSPVSVSSFSEFASAFGTMAADVSPGTSEPLHPLAFAVNDFFLNGGSRAVIVRVLGHPENALSALDNVGFNTLVITRHAAKTTIADVASLVSVAAPYCARRQAFLIVDPPASWDHPNVTQTFTNTVRHDVARLRSASNAPSNIGIFYPRILEPNAAMNGRVQAFSPSGAVAGIFARTDSQRGVWKAPAGVDATLMGATGLSVALNNAEMALFEGVGVNALRTFPMNVPVVWGARTLSGTSEYEYINVRRFALYIEQSISDGTKWVVFEPNTEPLWAALRLDIGSFMQSLFIQGAFAGSTPSQAYFVKCDSTTMTQSDIASGIVNVVVGFAPLVAAEFVVLQISQSSGATSTPSPH